MPDTESGELKYRRYIQKRRLTHPAEDRPREEASENSVTCQNPEPETRSFPRVSWRENEAALPDKGDLIRPVLEYRSPVHNRGDRITISETLNALRKRDHPLYRKLYQQQRYRTPAYPSGKSYTSQRAQIEDNMATLIAIKVIKQALACFAILGIIVLMQGRQDMQETLAVIRKHVVETHIDPRSLFENVKSAFSQLVRTLGGSP